MLVYDSSDILFFFNDTTTAEIYTLSLHDALPISARPPGHDGPPADQPQSTTRSAMASGKGRSWVMARTPMPAGRRSEEHTSELQSRQYLECRLLLEKK